MASSAMEEVITNQYLFRFDGAKENDLFMEENRARGIFVFAGIELRIGLWIPDFLMVSSHEGGRRFTLTIIELEASKTAALKSARKYLPESSNDIIRAFVDYLDSVIVKCRQTADPRYSTIESLQQKLKRDTEIKVETACALRSKPALIERHRLLDQPIKVKVRQEEVNRAELPCL